jgi:hypothetical protein
LVLRFKVQGLDHGHQDVGAIQMLNTHTLPERERERERKRERKRERERERERQRETARA